MISFNKIKYLIVFVLFILTYQNTYWFEVEYNNFWDINSSNTEIIRNSYMNSCQSSYFTLMWFNLFRNDCSPLSPLGNSNRYPWCDEDDITVWGYKISSCNVWATQSWKGIWTPTDCLWSFTNCNLSVPYIWHYFQWWRNDILTDWRTNIVSNTNPVWHNDFIYFNSDWLSVPNSDLWGWISNNPTLIKWPCLNWYHIPSYNEFQDVINIIAGENISAPYQYWNNIWSISNVLKMSMNMGVRVHFDWSYIMYESSYFWTSTPSWNWAISFSFDRNWANWPTSPIQYFFRTDPPRSAWFNIRCFKD